MPISTPCVHDPTKATVTVPGRRTWNVAAYPNELDAVTTAPWFPVSFQAEAGATASRTVPPAARVR